MTEAELNKAIALCDEIEQRTERTHKLLSEGIAGLIAACDEILAKCGQSRSQPSDGERR
jgi:hypothetical protein